MSRFYLLALVVTFFSVGGVGLAAPSADPTSAYGLVNANAGRAPTFEEQDNMKSVRRVGLGRYCLLAAIPFDNKTIGQLTTDLTLSRGKPGVAMMQTGSKLCKSPELAVVTFQFTAGGRLRLSNQIAFAANPEG